MNIEYLWKYIQSGYCLSQTFNLDIQSMHFWELFPDSPLKLSLQGMTIIGYQREIRLIQKSGWSMFDLKFWLLDIF